MKILIRILLAIVGVAAAGGAWAHKPSDSYLILRTAADDSVIHGQWDIALRDLEVALQLDTNRDGAITWVKPNCSLMHLRIWRCAAAVRHVRPRRVIC